MTGILPNILPIVLTAPFPNNFNAPLLAIFPRPPLSNLPPTLPPVLPAALPPIPKNPFAALNPLLRNPFAHR